MLETSTPEQAEGRAFPRQLKQAVPGARTLMDVWVYAAPTVLAVALIQSAQVLALVWIGQWTKARDIAPTVVVMCLVVSLMRALFEIGGAPWR